MEEKKLNEQESLALITQMIQNSKNNLGISCGDIFLSWGYTMLIVFVAILERPFMFMGVLVFTIVLVLIVAGHSINRKMKKANV